MCMTEEFFKMFLDGNICVRFEDRETYTEFRNNLSDRNIRWTGRTPILNFDPAIHYNIKDMLFLYCKDSHSAGLSYIHTVTFFTNPIYREYVINLKIYQEKKEPI